MAEAVKKAKSKRQAENDETLGLKNEDLIEIFNYMVLTRAVEDRIFTLYRQGKIVGGVYSGFGLEAISVGTSYALKKNDIIFPIHRDMGAHIVRGQTLKRIFCQFLGRANGPTRGTDSNMHMGYPEKRIFGQISHLGSMIPVAAGAGYAEKIRGRETCVMTYIGEGGSNIGDFHEGLNMAAVLGVGLVLVIENNQFAYSTPVHYQYKAKNLVDRAAGYGVKGIIIEDANDVMAVYKAAREAVNNAHKGNGPTLIEAVTMRMRGHSAHDDHKYVPQEMIDKWIKKDPIERFEKLLKSKKVLTSKKVDTMRANISVEIDEAVDFAMSSPYPIGPEAAENVFAE